jgi:aryl carrier-like protein
VPGELYIGGDGVAIGYWRQPDQSRARFVFNPFRPPSSEKMYRTGDMVRARPNGVIEFLGRRDNQVKVRGFRIETAEVELILKQFPRLTDCVVIARADSPGEKQLVAYYTALPPLPSSHELRQFANSMLPAYMVPDIFVHLNAIPCTPNGKTDRHALPSPAAVRSQMIRELIPPRNPQEKLLAEICQSILQVGEVGIDDDLFELGLHSLQLFQILARANNAGLNISPKDIMLGRTVGAIVAAMTKDSATMQVAQDSDDQASAMPPLIARTRDHYRVPRANFSEVGDSNG